ncbi:hypothetical protein FA15DRAFT_673835 [Coprinopsis marcescibilis]|uniref:Uncharacterized protein n=1 Tax=Coprinopsis marcescibilis TaxID=230819 RepID=A0A5C3KJK4_COPMA|nr:hypothetical protein FA15DRAFT_673835 [Coprinopsis marcescibilis]
MYGSNPYAQAGWSNPRNPLSVAWETNQPHSPTYGALPTSTTVPSPNIMTFRFNSQDTLNCIVVGPQNERIVTISTTYGSQRVTTFKASNDAAFASLEWHLQPLISIAGLVPRQEAMKWLAFSVDRRTASMTIGPDVYIWVFQGQNTVYLHKSDANAPERLAKMYWNNGLCLDVSVNSIRNGLLEVFLVAAALLQSRQESRA